MDGLFALEMPLLEILIRGSFVYLALVIMLRLIPKRNAGDISPNDMITLVVIATLAANAITGDTTALPDLLLMVLVIAAWDYLFNLLEYRFPRVRRITHNPPTLLIHNGELVADNLHREQLTKEELQANLRMQGVESISQVRQAILETDGKISILLKES